MPTTTYLAACTVFVAPGRNCPNANVIYVQSTLEQIAPGAVNPTGPQGPAGPQGPIGPVGPQGPAGTTTASPVTTDAIPQLDPTLVGHTFTAAMGTVLLFFLIARGIGTVLSFIRRG